MVITFVGTGSLVADAANSITVTLPSHSNDRTLVFL